MSVNKRYVSRASMSTREKTLRSQLNKLIACGAMARGTLVFRERVCGGKGCKCARGEKHPVVYLDVWRQKASTLTLLQLGHACWSIENEGFNESVTYWYADHVYKHDPTAMLTFWLMTMITYNLFHAFFHRNLKPLFRKKITMLHLARLMSSELYQAISTPRMGSPSPFLSHFISSDLPSQTSLCRQIGRHRYAFRPTLNPFGRLTAPLPALLTPATNLLKSKITPKCLPKLPFPVILRNRCFAPENVYSC